jgi:prepilin-type N-terminal cleavage/methylation domain-containing protein
MKKRPDQQGFSLVELLISLVVAGVIGTSIYFVFQGQSRVFFLQETVAQMQADLRFAMQTLKADIKRAGFMSGTINAWTDNFWCGNKPMPNITALRVTDGGGFVFNTTQNVNINPDSLYTSKVMGNVVFISQDPLLSPTLPTSAVDFFRMFPTNGLLRILDNNNRNQLQRITAQSFVNKSVTLQQVTRSTLMGCGPRGLGQGLLVNPVEYVEYAIVDTSNAGTCAGFGAAVNGRSTLVRRLLDPQGNVQTTIPVADYIIDMQFWFMTDTAAIGNNPTIANDLNPYDFQGNVTAVDLNLNPERARSVGIYLAARTPQEDTGFAFRPRQADPVGGNPALGPLTSFNLDADTTSSCRVRSLSSEVQLRNFQFAQRL